MADEFHLGSGNWWETPPATATTSFDTDTDTETPPVTTMPSISTTLNAIASFGWPPNSSSAASSSLLGRGHSSEAAVLANPEDLQIMGFGLSSHTHSMDWNQTAFVRGQKPESSFRALISDDLNSSNSDFPHESRRTQQHWSHKIYSSEDSSVTDFRRMNLGFSPEFSSQSSSNDSTTTSQNLAAYGLLLPDNQEPPPPSQNLQVMNYCYSGAECLPSWNNYSQFVRASASCSRPTTVAASGGGGHLHFTNNTPFWNASASSHSVADARPSFFPDATTQRQIHAPPSYGEKVKNTAEARGGVGSATKKTGPETSTKRSRTDASSPLPAVKVRKEKVGDRISALQQLVSPFGKTDTASVLSEAIEYIKYLHDQIRVSTTPYLKNGAPTQQQQQHQQSIDSSKEERPDLRSRGLCLLSVSSTFPLGHDSPVDFWTPTFGASFR